MNKPLTSLCKETLITLLQQCRFVCDVRGEQIQQLEQVIKDIKEALEDFQPRFDHLPQPRFPSDELSHSFCMETWAYSLKDYKEGVIQCLEKHKDILKEIE